MSHFGGPKGPENGSDGGIDFRTEERRPIDGGQKRYVAIVSGRQYPLRDLSDGGFSIAGDEATAPVKGHVEIRHGGRILRTGYAMRAWGQGRAVGYSMMSDLPVVVCAGANDETVMRARGIRRRLSRELEKGDLPGGAAKFGSRNRDGGPDEPDEHFRTRPASVTGLRERLGFGRKK